MSESSSGGIGILGILGILFVALKITHYIDWSWWWVLSPFWGGFAIWLLVVGIMVLVISKFSTKF